MSCILSPHSIPTESIRLTKISFSRQSVHLSFNCQFSIMDGKAAICHSSFSFASSHGGAYLQAHEQQRPPTRRESVNHLSSFYPPIAQHPPYRPVCTGTTSHQPWRIQNRQSISPRVDTLHLTHASHNPVVNWQGESFA